MAFKAPERTLFCALRVNTSSDDEEGDELGEMERFETVATLLAGIFSVEINGDNNQNLSQSFDHTRREYDSQNNESYKKIQGHRTKGIRTGAL